MLLRLVVAAEPDVVLVAAVAAAVAAALAAVAPVVTEAAAEVAAVAETNSATFKHKICKIVWSHTCQTFVLGPEVEFRAYFLLKIYKYVIIL